MTEKIEKKEFTPGEQLGYFIFSRLKPGELMFEDSKAFHEIINSEEFRNLAPKLLQDFAVSGIWDRDRRIVKSFTDLDGKVSLGLLEVGGFDTSKTKYILPGKSELGFLNIDTGNHHGFSVEGDFMKDELARITAWCDNHGKESKRLSSSAEFMYQALVELKFIKKNPVLDKIVEFNKKVESGDFDLQKEYWQSHKTLIGLNRFMNFKQVYDFFLSGRSFDDEVTDADIEKWSADEFLPPSFLKRKQEGKPIQTMKNYQKDQEENINQTKNILPELEKDGFFVKTDMGAILVSPENKLKGGYAAVYAAGADGYLAWSPEMNNFVLSMKEKELNVDFEEGVTVRKQIHIKPSWDGLRLTLSLKEILGKLGYHDTPSPKLKALFTMDEVERRGIFQVSLKQQGDSYISYLADVFSIFPKGWKPKIGQKNVAVRVGGIKKDKNGNDFYILNPVTENSK